MLGFRFYLLILVVSYKINQVVEMALSEVESL